MILAVPDFTFMRQINGQLRPPTIQAVIDGRFATTAPPAAMPAVDIDSPWLVATGGTLQLVDGRSDTSSPWQLEMKLSHFHSQQTTLTAAAEMFLFLKSDEEVVRSAPSIVAGSDDFSLIATRPPNAGRDVEANVQGLLALGAIKDPVAAQYFATVQWELAAVPEPQ